VPPRFFGGPARLRLFGVVHKYAGAKGALKRSAAFSPVLFLLDDPFLDLGDEDFGAGLALLRDLTVRGHTVICVDNSERMRMQADYLVELAAENSADGRRTVVLRKGVW
jgi:excinuclease UvrABC ATPase subunit